MQEQSANVTVGATGLDEELEMIREQFRRFAVEKVEPFAHDWHLKDELIPMEIIDELAEMGVFGLTIPEEYGGFGLSKSSMCVVSEELSRGYIGVGSLGTRSEIAAELILCGGTEEQKQKWLPDWPLPKLCRRLCLPNPIQGLIWALAHPRRQEGRRLGGHRQQNLDHPCRPHPCHDDAGPHGP